MRALVTGATGFIGEPLCHQLAGDGAFVRAATRRPQPLPFTADTIAIDAIDASTHWADALRTVDTVFHLAGIAHLVAPRDQAQADYERVNAEGTEQLAREAARAGVTRFVFLSSLKVNGETSPPAGFREGDPSRPDGSYAVSKQHAEERLAAVSRETGLAVTIIRPPLVYGPGVRANFLSLLRAVARRRPLPLASIDNRRSLVYVENLCSALRAAAVHPAAAGQTFLVSDGEPVAVADLIRRIAAALRTEPRLFPVPLALLRTAGTVVGRREAIDKLAASLVVDDSKIRRMLGWDPPHTLDAGLAETAAWYRRTQNA